MRKVTKVIKVPSATTRYREKEIEDIGNKILIDKIYCLKNILSSEMPISGLSESRKSILSEDNLEIIELKLMALIMKLA